MKDKEQKGRPLVPGETVYAIVTGMVSFKPWIYGRSKAAINYMATQDGFVGVHPHDGQALIWFYDSENAAKVARNNGMSKGIQFGKNVSRFIVDENGVPVFDTTQIKEGD